MNSDTEFTVSCLVLVMVFRLNDVTFIWYPQAKQEIQSATQVSHDSQTDQPKNHTTEAPVTDSASISTSSNDGKKVSREDIELVRELISSYNFNVLSFSNDI